MSGTKIIQVKVKPNARSSEILEGEDGIWTARIAAPPVGGRANAELVKLVARHFGVARSRVAIRSGASGRMKLVEIDVP
jgi:uncharacterized protein